jgi:hypothetical protein
LYKDVPVKDLENKFEKAKEIARETADVERAKRMNPKSAAEFPGEMNPLKQAASRKTIRATPSSGGGRAAQTQADEDFL